MTPTKLDHHLRREKQEINVIHCYPKVGENGNLILPWKTKPENTNRYVLDLWYRVFSRDVTAATSVPLHKGTVAMLVTPVNTPGI